MNDHDTSIYFVGWVLGHVASTAAIIAVLAGWLPPLAAAIALIWYVIQIAESDTYRKLQSRRRLRKIVALEAHLAQLRKHHDALERQDT